MKTFGFFILLWLASILTTFVIWENVKSEEMLKMVLATQLAYIMYRLTKEESKD
jgi:hypothetical protein